MAETMENKIKMPENQEDSGSEKYVIFSVFECLYSFPSRYISEISRSDTVFPLPLMPPYMLGVINRYSSPYALFDIGLLFYNKPSSQSDGQKNMDKKVLIIKDSVDRIAFLIDDVSDIIDIPLQLLVKVERDLQENNLSEAVCSIFNWNNNNVFILDIEKILQCVSRDIAHRGTFRNAVFFMSLRRIYNGNTN